MSDSVFLNEVVTGCYGKISDEDLDIVKTEISMILTNYDVMKKQTAIVEHDYIPECLKAYLVTKKIEGRSDGTIYLYKLYLEDFFRVLQMPMESISANEIRLYLYHIKEYRNISDSSLDSRRKVIKSFFSWCHNDGYISMNPCSQIAPIKTENKLREPYTDIEMELLRDACITNREKAIIEVLYSTGCRVSELVKIKLDDINFETKEIRLFGKGRKHRISYINARAEIALRKYLKCKKGNSEYVFVSLKSPYVQIHKGAVERELRKIGIRAGIKNTIPHRFRHTTATNALNRGMNTAELQIMLGHESIDTTMIYAKVNQNFLAASHQKYIT